MLFKLFLSSLLVYAQEIPCDKTALCEKTVETERLELTAPAKPFLKISRGTFCLTPFIISKYNLVTACNNGTIYFLSPSGSILQKPAPIKFSYNKEIYSGDISFVEVPNSKPKKFIAAVESTGEIAVISESGSKQIIAKVDELILNPKMLTEDKVIFNLGLSNESAILDLKTKQIIKTTHPLNGEGEIPTIITSNDSSLAAYTSSTGSISLISSDGKTKSIKLGESALNNPCIAPDGTLWTTDATGKLYFFDPKTNTYKYVQLDLGELNKIPTLDKRTSKIAFLNDGKYALEYSGNIYFYNSNHTLSSVFDLKKTKEQYSNTDYEQDKLLNFTRPFADIQSIKLPDGTMGIWIPTYGGQFVLNSKGEAVATFKQPKIDDWSAEMMSAPYQLPDGSYYIGMYYGVEKFKLSKGQRKLKSTTLVPCGK